MHRDRVGTTIYTGPTPEDLARIPAALTTRRQWILWRGADRIYKPTGVVVGLDKIPINPQTESKASATNPDTWGGFEECLAALPLNLEKWEQENPDAYRGGGLGFVFASDDPYVGIDLDHCRDPESGEITALAKKIIETLASYAEVSPSGTGVHVWAQGPLPQGRRKKGPVEMYASSRFFTVTGWHLPDTPPTIEEREAQIAAVHWACLGQPDSAQEKSPAQGKRPAGQEAQALALDDTALLDKARSAKNKDKFNRLWNGDDTGYPSPSEADLALCMLLAFWTRDPDQIDRLFRESRLIRDKWDEQHGELTYGEGTIQKALARQTTYYTPPRRDAQRRRNGHTASTPGTTATPGDFFDYPIDGKFKVFIPRLLGEALLARNTYRHTASQLWVYRNGVYLPCGEATLYADAQTLLGNERRTNRLREALSYVEVATQFDDESPPDRTYINLLNGRLAWETGELESHTPEVFTTVQLPIEYDATALCPVFDNYLVTTFSADDIPLIEEILGWCLVPDLRFELAVMLTGEGDNGKSVFLDLVGYLLGEANISNVALQDLEENRFRAAELYGKLANVFADLDARGLQTSSMFKTLTTGDCITAERKHGQPFRFRSYAKLLFSANKIPTSKDKTYAFYKPLVNYPIF